MAIRRGHPDAFVFNALVRLDSAELDSASEFVDQFGVFDEVDEHDLRLNPFLVQLTVGLDDGVFHLATFQRNGVELA